MILQDRGDVDRPSFNPWKPASGKISLVWDRNLVTLKHTDGINVVAPVWFSVEEDEWNNNYR